jgi:hypothetical protein
MPSLKSTKLPLVSASSTQPSMQATKWRPRIHLLSWLLAATSLTLLSSPVGAQSKVKLDVTETSVLNYHFDNGDTFRQNDKYGEWLNRLNLQLRYDKFTAAVRFDSAYYFLKPDPNKLAEEDAIATNRVGNNDYIRSQTYTYGTDLSSRFINTFYPAKMYITYANSGFDVTAGDYYAQLGKGLILSLRKVDELGVDTTIRGLKVGYKKSWKDFKLGAVALGGVTNPIRIDNVSGRQLTQTTTGLFENIMYPNVPDPRSTDYIPNAEPTFTPDFLAGGQVEAGNKYIVLGLRGVHLNRNDAVYHQSVSVSAARNNEIVEMASGSINLPNLFEHGSLYTELAFERLANPYPIYNIEKNDRLSGGHAFYALATAYTGPITFTAEFKKYDRFFPLSANVGRRNSIEFAQLQYNVVPTTELIISDTQFEDFNVCVTGGRVRMDYRAAKQVLIYSSLGRYRTYSETSADCGESEVAVNGVSQVLGKNPTIQNDVWDPLIGTELTWNEGRSHLYAWTGVRFDDAATPKPYDGVAEPTTLYYREAYVRYDLVQKVTSNWSIETQGFHRYRHYPQQAPMPWREGQNYLSFIRAPKYTLALGYEYTDKGGELQHFFNALIQYRITTDKVVRMFVGENRASLRCVSGVCRLFPAFSGATLEAVLRF